MFNEKGQGSPFELLVAVIIMTFVILIGTQAMAKLKEEQCISELKKNMQEFKFSLEKIVDPGTPQQLSFTPPACYKGEEIKIAYQTHKQICTHYCEEPRSECVLLQYYSPEGGGYYVCVKIPITTYFEDVSACTDFAPGKEVQVIKYGEEAQTSVIEKGLYYFRNVSKPGEAFPSICVYRITGVGQ